MKTLDPGQAPVAGARTGISRHGPRPARRAPGVRWLAVSATAMLAAAALSICIGGQPSSLQDVLHAVFTPTGSVMDVTIRELRWPRTILAVCAGICLGLAGALVQGHTRNPVADPGLLGINQGAALAIVAATAAAGEVPALSQALLAFAGALAASVLVFMIGSAARHGSTPVTLVLAGAAVTALCSGLVAGIVLLNDQALDTLRFWQVGSLAGRSDVLSVVWPFILAGAVLAVLNIKPLNALALGADTAVSLGVPVFRARSAGIAAVTLLAGSAVTMAGPIAFAGLLVPHITRAMTGPDYRWLIPVSAVTGATVLLLADTAGRVIARPGELSVGVVLAVVGAPFFVYLARRRRLAIL
ncbi:iron complex transport system permease protein [Arthrobacter sp. V4I6]|uniref:FecCD family ABC transporter permease n=1 Tax=unclassified Arthrobacter TaxID=235627 RepID=UPI00277D9AF7|nr:MULTISPECIES: iron ABC transporter permease [unclassified Arthrobacter]MDQ0820958.1 iron complex transport system permease protein [Arthrobacter sp. V1I7]MDQ0855219.1 iron complex transport system permease protein [Arthrobacter sp. V4I6]